MSDEKLVAAFAVVAGAPFEVERGGGVFLLVFGWGGGGECRGMGRRDSIAVLTLGCRSWFLG